MLLGQVFLEAGAQLGMMMLDQLRDALLIGALCVTESRICPSEDGDLLRVHTNPVQFVKLPDRHVSRAELR